MCYRFVEYSSVLRGTFDSVIDCTYVLLMENSPREESILKTVKEAQLTKCVRIQYNKGFRKCTKNLPEQRTNFDLMHALQNVFKDALMNGYERIVVLEDDCLFDERIHDPEVVNDLTTFLRDTNPKVYNLGTMIFLTFPWAPLFQKHHRMLCGSMTHAMIYNKKYMETVVQSIHMSTDIEPTFHFSAFTYHKPLAYQLFTPTENSQEGWYGAWPAINYLIFERFHMDTCYQPGFDRMYKVSHGMSIVIFLLIFFLLPLHLHH